MRFKAFINKVYMSIKNNILEVKIQKLVQRETIRNHKNTLLTLYNTL